MPQSLAKVYIHVVFSTKDRKAAIGDEWRDALFVGAAANNVGCESLLTGGVADHVHRLFVLSRKLSLSDAVGTIKSHSPWWVNQNHPSTAMFHWQNGYAVFSVSQSSVAAVREYIRRQPQYHATQTFQDELREWLRRYEIDWDEQYLWD